jgi:hypothetical protein
MRRRCTSCRTQLLVHQQAQHLGLEARQRLGRDGDTRIEREKPGAGHHLGLGHHVAIDDDWMRLPPGGGAVPSGCGFGGAGAASRLRVGGSGKADRREHQGGKGMDGAHPGPISPDRPRRKHRERVAGGLMARR